MLLFVHSKGSNTVVDEEVGKFACVVCRKRFTRSDLLNRHRRIHNPQPETGSPHGNTAKNSSTTPPQPDFEDLSKQSIQNAAKLTSQEPAGRPTAHTSNDVYTQLHPEPGTFINQGHAAHASYQGLLPPDDVQNPPSLMVPSNAAQPQGLTSLMEAALTPQDGYAFTPAENFNPSLWGGFMLFSDNSNAYMGSYDADISWALGSSNSGSSPDGHPERDSMHAVDDFTEDQYQYQAVPYRQDDVSHLDAADNEDEDTNDWPDKVAHSSHTQSRASRIVPLHLIPVSWQSVLDEARTSGLSATTIRPYQHIDQTLHASLLSTLNGSSYRNELSRPEISNAIFPPAEALDFFIRLYIRYIHPRFPILHLPTFDIYNSSPLLLIAMMFLGSSHSRADRGRFSRVFYDHLRIACLHMHEVDPKFVSIDNSLLANASI